MIDRLTVLCFGGTYALALVCDLARFFVRSEARRYATFGLTALGWIVQTVFLINLAVRKQELPVATVFESLVVLAWILTAIDLYLILRSPRSTAVGLFVLPLTLTILVVAARLPRDDWTAFGGGWLKFWGSVHGLLLLAGASATSVGFVAGLMYLVQANRLKHKRPPRFGIALPSLEQSERLHRAAIAWAFPLLSFGFAIGLGLIVAGRKNGEATVRWLDPKVLSSLAVWLVFAALLHARFRPAMRGRRIMLLTVVAFAFLIFSMAGVNLLLPTSHGVSGIEPIGGLRTETGGRGRVSP